MSDAHHVQATRRRPATRAQPPYFVWLKAGRSDRPEGAVAKPPLSPLCPIVNDRLTVSLGNFQKAYGVGIV